VDRIGRTNREIEIKVRVSDLPEMLRRLGRMGGARHPRVFEQNFLYDTPGADFRRRGRLLRVRLERLPSGAVRGLLTYKAPPSGKPRKAQRYKERIEREVALRDPRRADGLLRAAGFRPGFCYEKYRTSFRLPGLHLDLDETPVGIFLEVEGRPGAIERAARALGYTPRDFMRGTYWDLYAADCRRRGREPKNMLFPRKKSSRSAVFA